PREERAIVARVVPGQPTLVETVLPEGHGELDRLDRFLAVDDDLALVVDLGGPEAPGHGIRPAIGIAQAVAESLPDREVLLLEHDANLTQLVPGIRELVRAGLLEPVLAVVPDAGAHGEGDGLPSAVDHVDLAADVVEGAVSLADLLHDVVNVGEAVGIEVWP